VRITQSGTYPTLCSGTSCLGQVPDSEASKTPRARRAGRDYIVRVDVKFLHTFEQVASELQWRLRERAQHGK